jgi:hypothetical protein
MQCHGTHGAIDECRMCLCLSIDLGELVAHGVTLLLQGLQLTWNGVHNSVPSSRSEVVSIG